MTKRHERSIYIFAVGMRDGATTASFAVKGIEGGQTVEVIGESRTVSSHNGSFKDSFSPWDAHLYRLPTH
jgi:hypothetical protein